MSTSLLLSKVLLGSLSVAGCLAAGGFALHHGRPTPPTSNPTLPDSKTTLPTPQKHSIVLAHGMEVSDASPTDNIEVTKGSENYKCKLSDDSAPAADCKLAKLTMTKGWIDLGGIKKATQTEAIPKTDLAETTNYFKLEVDEAFYSSIKLPTKKTIEIVSSSDSTKKFGTLNTLFKFSGSEVEFDKTSYLLGKAQPGSTAPTANEKYECSQTVDNETSNLGTCTFYAFGSETASLSGAGYSNQTTTSLLGTPAESPLTANNYYLIKYSSELDKSKATASQEIQINKPISDYYSEAGSFKDVVPVILHGVDNSKQTFILSETPSYSVVVQKTNAIAAGKTLTHDQKTKNYQCRLDTQPSVKCNLVTLPFDSSSKTSLTLDAVKTAALTTELSISTADATPVFYKLELEPTLFNTLTSAAISSKTINVVELNTDGSEQSVLFTLDPLFAIGDDDSLHFDSSTFIIKNSDFTGGVANGALTDGKNRFCSFSATDKGGADAKQCSLIDLGTTLSDTTDITTATAATTIEASKIYLVKFATPQDKGFSKAANTGNEFFIFESGSDETHTNRQQVAKFSAPNVEPAIIVDGTSPAQFAFRLA